jgi:hypothetical protein
MQLLLIFCCVDFLSASNWAQTSGKVQQNVVIPRIPTPSYPHWTQRFGHAIVVATNISVAQSLGAKPLMYMIGGDTFEGDFDGENVDQIF